MLFRFRLASPLMAEIFWKLPFRWSFLWKYSQQFASMLGSQFLMVHFFFQNTKLSSVCDVESPGGCILHLFFWKWCDWLKDMFYWKLHSNKNLWTWKEKFLIYYLTPTPPFRGESDVMQFRKKKKWTKQM